MKKTTPQKLSNRLAQYGALTVAMAGIADANGQIGYHDVDPDVGGVGVIYQIQMNIQNGDPTVHFTLKHISSSSYRYFTIENMPGNSFLGLNSSAGGSGSFDYPYALNSGAVINSSAPNSWINVGGSVTMSFDSCNPSYALPNDQWCGLTGDKFLGLRFKIGANTHYGWARINNDGNNGNWLIKDHGFNPTPDAPINANQQITLGINSNTFSNVKIVALNKSIALYNLPHISNYRLFNISGQSVLDGNIENNTHVIEANTLASGIYIIELTDASSKAVIRKKLIL